MRFISWPILFLLVTICLPLDPNRYQWQIFMGSIAFLLLLTHMIYKRVGILAGILFLYLTLSCALIFFSPTFPWIPMDIMTVFVFKECSARTLLFILTITLPVLLTPKKMIPKWMDGFVIVGLISCLCILDKTFWRQLYFLSLHMNSHYLADKIYPHLSLVYGILSNSAQDATYLGLILPYMFCSPKWRKFTIPVGLCIILAQSSTGFAILFFQLSALGYSYLKNKWKKISYALSVGVSAPFLGKLMLGDKLFNNDGRYDVWKLTWDYFKNNINHWVGSGPSGFLINMPAVQLSHSIKSVFLWAHNDFLQILFEYGIIGLTLTICLYFLMLFRSKNVPWIFVTLVSMLIGGLFQMPLRLMIMCFFYVVMCEVSINSKDFMLIGTKD